MCFFASPDVLGQFCGNRLRMYGSFQLLDGQDMMKVRTIMTIDLVFHLVDRAAAPKRASTGTTLL